MSDIKHVEIDPTDLRIDTYRAARRDQSLSVIDQGIRITHTPSGVSVYANDERSIHQNRAKAMAKLQIIADTNPTWFVKPEPVDPRGKPIGWAAVINDDDVIAISLSKETVRLRSSHYQDVVIKPLYF